MSRKNFVVAIAFTFAVFTAGCNVRQVQDKLSQGAHGPSSPAESGRHGADAYNRPPFAPEDQEKKIDAMHQTAGIMPEYTNGKVDPTMEGSGNLAWQGSYERAKRTSQQNQARP